MESESCVECDWKKGGIIKGNRSWIFCDYYSKRMELARCAQFIKDKRKANETPSEYHTRSIQERSLTMMRLTLFVAVLAIFISLFGAFFNKGISKGSVININQQEKASQLR